MRISSRLRASLIACVVILVCLTIGAGLGEAQESPGNKPERLEWFRDLGFGLFIHWSFYSQLGVVIAHSAVGASDDYTKRFFEELPMTFNPKRFDPDEWATLAKLAGFKYVVFTAKHHAGFCMFNTTTTDFSIMNTPYGRDITAEIARAFRDKGIVVGFYYSPDDFYFLYTHGRVISRRRPGALP
jgi:alpha-L-fucosidase